MSSLCQLTPHDRFFSSLLTAAVGSIVTGISAGALIAFGTAWISWFAATRILCVGLWFCYKAVTGKNLEGFSSLLRKIPILNRARRIREVNNDGTNNGAYTVMAPPTYDEAIRLESHGREADAAASSRTSPLQPDHLSLGNSKKARSTERSFALRMQEGFQATPPSVLGWIGWLYATTYFPIVQILWLVSNWHDTPYAGIAKIVRAFAIAVTALPLTIDTKARYAVMLEQRYGRWANRVFTYVHTIATLTLAVTSLIMLALAVIQANIPMQFVPMFIILSIVWMFGSFAFFPPVDGGVPPTNVRTFFAGLAMGIFSGVFTAAPSFGAMVNAPTSPGVGLGDYLGCESASVWEKFVAIFP